MFTPEQIMAARQQRIKQLEAEAARLAPVLVAAGRFLTVAVDRGWVLPDATGEHAQVADEDDRAAQALRDALHSPRNHPPKPASDYVAGPAEERIEWNPRDAGERHPIDPHAPKGWKP